MKSLWTPTEVAVSRAAVYAWLRATFPLPVDRRWLLDEDMATRVRERFTGTDPGTPTGTVLARRVRPARARARALQDAL